MASPYAEIRTVNKLIANALNRRFVRSQDTVGILVKKKRVSQTTPTRFRTLFVNLLFEKNYQCKVGLVGPSSLPRQTRKDQLYKQVSPANLTLTE